VCFWEESLFHGRAAIAQRFAHAVQGDMDIAFAASTVVIGPDMVANCYSISDRRLYRSLLHVDGAIAESGILAKTE